MTHAPINKQLDLEKVVFLLHTSKDQIEVAAFRLVDLAANLKHTPQEFYQRFSEIVLDEWWGANDWLTSAAAETDQLFASVPAWNPGALNELRAVVESQGMLAFTESEFRNREFPRAKIKLPDSNPTAAPVPRTENAEALLVTSISIEGSVLRDMYDEHPGLAYFSSPSSVSVSVPKPITLHQAIDKALAAWKSVCGDDGDDNEHELDYEEYDGQFTASQIVLRDVSGDVVQKYDGQKWITDFAPVDEWSGLLDRAKSLEDEASEEARWDNFSTAQGLREQATELRRQVSIARANLPDSAAIAPQTPEKTGTEPSASGDSSALSRNQILFAKRAAMATAFFVALPHDDDHGFDRLMEMQFIHEVKPNSDGWGEIFLHDHLKGWDLQALKNNVFGVALNLVHNLSGIPPELAGEQLNRYPTTIPLSREGDLTHVPYHKVTVGPAGQNVPARDESPSLDM